MTNKLYKFQIDAPSTANKVKSYLLPLDKRNGEAFRIEAAWISFPSSDAIATGDKIGFQISQTDQSENAALLEIDDVNEVYTWQRVDTFTQRDDPADLIPDRTKAIPLEDIVGTMMETNKKNYINSIITGQDAADVATKVKILGQYISKDMEDWNSQTL